MTSSSNKKASTIEVIKAEKERFRRNLSTFTTTDVTNKVSSVREEVSTVLEHAINIKKKNAEDFNAKDQNVVTIDRVLKFAKSLAISSYKHFYAIKTSETTANKEIHKFERLLGDLARYASIASGIPRACRAPSQKEVAEQYKWAVRCLEHYDQSGWPFASYHNRINKLFHSSKVQLLYAVLFNTRYYNLLALSSPVQSEWLGYVELSTKPFQTLDGSVWEEFGQVTSIITYQLKEKLIYPNYDHASLIYKHGTKVRDRWQMADPNSISDESALTIIFILESLTEMMPESKFFTSKLLQSSLLKARSQSLREANEALISCFTPILQYYWKTANTDKPLIKKIQILCANPNGYSNR